MPKSRKLLAVPFVGKDVPSRASEFSHPDVVIGERDATFFFVRSDGLYRSYPTRDSRYLVFAACARRSMCRQEHAFEVTRSR